MSSGNNINYIKNKVTQFKNLIFQHFIFTLLMSRILQVLKSKTNEPSRIGKVKSVSQGLFKMGKRKPKLMNGKVLGPWKERKRKKEAQPGLCKESFLGE